MDMLMLTNTRGFWWTPSENFFFEVLIPARRRHLPYRTINSWLSPRKMYQSWPIGHYKDFNLLENLWIILKVKVCEKSPQNTPELKKSGTPSVRTQCSNFMIRCLKNERNCQSWPYQVLKRILENSGIKRIEKIFLKSSLPCYWPKTYESWINFQLLLLACLFKKLKW